ncbi:DUF2017 domain-containing protein [Stackebrandtia nassauensis]|uniref:Uncharacterized protein n=1 Tax=Stackebrandtia nassauensis (strain DSM 44728 / CIP 108903 / NRRL B-16338 / NBRC 102104 / LLR-40K-21) TaxID=446470 RepID=D3PYJ9_STANL|nr:DUF2017 domain-containing protein [Stackebrandtia nassauensis]ADD41566.1 hypothetical protein Snas_1870 [Stackebrandtia nassauensis DSM 44728]
MAGYFEPLSGGGATILLGQVEISVLHGYATQLLDLLGPGQEPAHGDAEALLASVFTDQPDEPPTDPVLARLFPDAYDDPDRPPDDETRAASAEFRRYTESDMRARKRGDILTLIRCLETLTPSEPDGTELRLNEDECRQWLGALNDLRLALGTRLDITGDHDSEAFLQLPDSDPRKPSAMVYLWLSGLQETLIDSLTGSTDN